MNLINLFGTSFELGLMTAIVVMALFLSYLMLNVCDLSTDGCFTLGAVVGSLVTLSGHPFLGIIIACFAGMISGFITAILQTKMGIDSLLSGIVVNTGLYSINIALMGGSSLINLNKCKTIFTEVKSLFEPIFMSQYKLALIIIIVLILLFLLNLFLKTRLGLAIRATGDNPDMVKSSSIDPHFTTIVGLTLANGFTGISGCLLAEYQKSVNIDIGTGMVTIALASLLIGTIIYRKRVILIRIISVIIGAVIFRFVYTVALMFNMPSYMLRLVSSIIVILVIATPYLKTHYSFLLKNKDLKIGGK